MVVISSLPAAGILATHQWDVNDSADHDIEGAFFMPGNQVTLPSRSLGSYYPHNPKVDTSLCLHYTDGKIEAQRH